MAIADDRLKNFFSSQKVGVFDALKKGPAPIKKMHSIDRPQHTIISDKNINDASVIREQIVSDPLAIQQQAVSTPLPLSELPVSVSLAYDKQTVSNPVAIPLAINNPLDIDWNVFSAKEKDLLKLIFEQCSNNCSLISPAISTEEIRNALNISPERVRNLIFRIVKKGGVTIKQHKSGQNAFRKFELSKSLYQAIIDEQSYELKKAHTSLANPLAASSHISNSIYINKTITDLPEEWKKINYEELIPLGFSETQLHQLFAGKFTTPEIVQESINHFAYGFQNNEKTKAYIEPLNVFMGVLRKGQRWCEANYISPQEKALKQLIEDKKEQKEKQEKMVKELAELEFPEWRKNLSEEEIKLIVPKNIVNMALAEPTLRLHFLEKVLTPRLLENGIIK